MPSEDEFDAIPDEFDGFDFDAIPDLQVATNQPTASPALATIPLPGRASPDSSSVYSCDNDIDASVLAELDAIENRLVQDQSGQSAATLAPPSDYAYGSISSLVTNVRRSARLASPFSGPPSESSPRSHPRRLPQIREPSTPRKPIQKTVDSDISPRKRGRTAPSPMKSPSSVRNGKSKVPPTDGIRQILEGFEHEMTCPICCDIFVAAHLGNPCGHSYCGECGWEWISKNKRAPTCAVCRAKLSASAPMIPNFALDNTVARHLQALAASGEDEWQPNGTRITEWNAKKEKWRKDSASRAADAAKKSRPRSSRQGASRNIHNLINDVDIDIVWQSLMAFDDEQDESYEADSDVEEVIPRSVRPRRTRAQR